MTMQWHKVSYSSQGETKHIKDLKKTPATRKLQNRIFCQISFTFFTLEERLLLLRKGRNAYLLYFLEVYKALRKGIFQHFQSKNMNFPSQKDHSLEAEGRCSKKLKKILNDKKSD